MPTRRELIEAALVDERIALWADFAYVHSRAPIADPRIFDLIRRIRTISDALGYPTEWEQVPVAYLEWYVFVESSHALGITAEPVDLDELRRQAREHGYEIVPATRHERDIYTARPTLDIDWDGA